MKKNATATKVEGEGSYEASRRYNDAVAKHAKSGEVERLAKKAAQALDGAEGKELRQAEARGKRGPRAK